MASDDNTRQQHDIVKPVEEIDNEEGAETLGGSEGLEEAKTTEELVKEATGKDPSKSKKKLKPVLQ